MDCKKMEEPMDTGKWLFRNGKYELLEWAHSLEILLCLEVSPLERIEEACRKLTLRDNLARSARDLLVVCALPARKSIQDRFSNVRYFIG